MKKLGFRRKDEDDEDSSRSALFGSRSKPKPPAAAPQNPYAQPAAPPDPYTQAKIKAGIIPRPGADNLPGGGDGRPGYPPGPPPQAGYGYQSGPPQGGYGYQSAPPPQSGYGNMGRDNVQPEGYARENRYGLPPAGYAADNKFGPQGGYTGSGYGAQKYGNQGGYGAEKPGSNPYGRASQSNDIAGYRPGGYGGLGPTMGDDVPDANRDELFSSARERAQQRQQNNSSALPEDGYNPSGNDNKERSYGAYGDRQLTAEEEEEEDIDATKQDIKFVKQQGVSSTRRALQLAAQAEEASASTLARLGAQGERLHNTRQHLDMAASQNRIAEEKARELKVLNRSLLAVHVNNPFNSKQREARREEELLDQHRAERDQREATREAAFKSTQRMNQNFKGLSDAQQRAAKPKGSLAERAKYQFEADSEDDQMEDEIERNTQELSGAVGRINLLAKANLAEIESQNHLLKEIGESADREDERIHLNIQRLKRIR